MANAPLGTVMHHLRRMLAPPTADAVSDAQLLERFVAHRDEASFELLVWRHERMVLGVCRRLLDDAHDAEDAFQATFLTLVRKANAISKRESVASWLYKVAYRVALRLRSGRARHSVVEFPPGVPAASAQDEPTTAAVWRELRPLLDDEINRLPRKYHVPVVLCYLEGKTYDEVARQLGCSRGTLAARLSRARDLLRRRLLRRGVALSTGLLALLLAEQAAEAAVPAVLVASTVRAALFGGPGKAVAAGVISSRVAALTQGALQAMLFTKIKMVAVMLLAASAAGVGTGVLNYRTLAQDPAGEAQNERRKVKVDDEVDPPPRAAKQPNKEAEDAGWQERATLKGHEKSVMSVAFSPDGKTLATASLDGVVRLWDVATGKERAAIEAQSGGQAHGVAFSPDGKHLAAGGGKRGESGLFSLWDTATGQQVAIFAREKDIVTSVALSPDGQWLASGCRDSGVCLTYYSRDRGETHYLKDHTLPVFAVAFSPDGKLLATAGGEEFLKDDNKPGELIVWATATQKKLWAYQAPKTLASVAFSPDGRLLATSGADGTTRLLDAKSGKVIRELKGHEDMVRCVAFSPDGKTLATGSFDEDVKFWDLATGKELTTLRGHQRGILSLAFSPDGRFLATGSGAPGKPGQVTIWELKTGARVFQGPRDVGLVDVGNGPELAKRLAALNEFPRPNGRLEKLLNELVKNKRSDEQIVEALYLATLAQLPTEEQKRTVLDHIARKKDRNEGYHDVLWALLNSLEFSANAKEMFERDPRSPKK
jgi:RNA polymerase sigma factor (sigma-70 family)